MKHFSYSVVRTFANGLTGLMGSFWDSREKAEKFMKSLSAVEGASDRIVCSRPYDEQEYRYWRAING